MLDRMRDRNQNLLDLRGMDAGLVADGADEPGPAGAPAGPAGAPVAADDNAGLEPGAKPGKKKWVLEHLLCLTLLVLMNCSCFTVSRPQKDRIASGRQCRSRWCDSVLCRRYHLFRVTGVWATLSVSSLLLSDLAATLGNLPVMDSVG